MTVGEMVTYLTDKVPAATKFNQKPTVEGVYDESFPLSVLTTNAVIADAIARRPAHKESSAKTIFNTITTKPADEILSHGKAFEQGSCYGVVTFVNTSKYILNLK